MHIRKMEETVHGLELKIRERDLKNKCLQDKVLCSKSVSYFILHITKRILGTNLIRAAGKRTGISTFN